MAPREFGQAGYYLRIRGIRTILLWTVPLLLVAVALFAIAVTNVAPVFGLCLVLLVPVSPILAKRWERAANRAIDPYAVGYEGECDVARALREALGDDYYLIHDIDLGCGNVDHVVVARSGIFTIETKANLAKVEAKGDRLLVNGFSRERDLKQAYREAMQVKEYLEKVSCGRNHYVTPLLVFTRANVSASGKCRGVYVMGLNRLAKFVSYEREKLDPLRRSAIANALKTCATRPETRGVGTR